MLPSPAPAAPSGGHRGDAPWARGAACLGPPSGARGPRGAAGSCLLAPLQAEPRGPRPSPSAPRDPRNSGLPGRNAAGAPAWRESARRSSLGGFPFFPGAPLPPRSGFPVHSEKNAACTHLFILQQLQGTMKLFKNQGNALSSRAVVVFNEPLPAPHSPPTPPLACPPRPSPAYPSPS